MKKFLLFILFAAFSLSISASGAVVIDGTATVKMEIKNPIEAEKTAEKELKHYFHNCVTNSKLEIIMLKLLKVLKQEF